MADFNRNRSDRSGGGYFRKKGFNDRGFSGGRSFDRPTMHKTVCDKCRQECEVPFRPTSGKPVYCNNCFDRPTSRRPEGRGFENRNRDFAPKPQPQYEQQFALLNSKLDQVLNILMPIVAEAEAEEITPEPVEEVLEEVKAPKKSASKKK